MSHSQVIQPNIWSLSIDQPFYEPTTVYLIKDSRNVLIDTGHSSSIGALRTCLQQLMLDFHDIDTILYTHPHVDHIGGAIHLSQPTQTAPPWHAIHHEVLHQENIWASSNRQVHRMIQKIEAEVQDYRKTFTQKQILQFANRCFPLEGQASFQIPLSHGQRLNFGTTTFTVLESPGHSPYHLCFYDEERGILFSGDLLLRAGTALTTATGDSHGAYLQSLVSIDTLEAQLVLPAHGRPYSTLETAVKIARRMYYFIENSILRVLDNPKTAYEITRLLFGNYIQHIEYAFLGYARVKSYLDWLDQQEKVKIIEKRESGYDLFGEIIPLYQRM